MRRIAYFADSNIVNLTLGYLSFDISLDLTAEIGVAACSSNPRCAGLGGDCCPTSSGVYLDCCS